MRMMCLAVWHEITCTQDGKEEHFQALKNQQPYALPTPVWITSSMGLVGSAKETIVKR